MARATCEGAGEQWARLPILTPQDPTAAAAPYLGALGTQAPQGGHGVGEEGADSVSAGGAVAGAVHEEDDVTTGIPADCGYTERLKPLAKWGQAQPVPPAWPRHTRALADRGLSTRRAPQERAEGEGVALAQAQPGDLLGAGSTGQCPPRLPASCHPGDRVRGAGEPPRGPCPLPWGCLSASPVGGVQDRT